MKSAADSQEEFFQRNTQSWLTIARITLCNLLLRKGEQVGVKLVPSFPLTQFDACSACACLGLQGEHYFDLDLHILPFIDTHLDELSGANVDLSVIRDEISDILSSNPVFFLNHPQQKVSNNHSTRCNYRYLGKMNKESSPDSRLGQSHPRACRRAAAGYLQFSSYSA